MTRLLLQRLAPLALLLALCSASPEARAQDCPGLSYTLVSQAEVDAFPSTCSAIAGALLIGDTTGSSDITDLTPLDGLTSVGISLGVVGNPLLTSLDGLGGLVSAGQNLLVLDNPALASLGGLGGLASGMSVVQVNNNDALQSLAGLGGIPSVDLAIAIVNNDALASLDGLGGLTSVGQSISISNNAALESLDGLDALASVGSVFQAVNNATLSACAAGLSGLISGDPPAFTGVAEAVSIASNAPGGACNSPADVLAASGPVACTAGSFSDTGTAPCTLAPAGFFVADNGAVQPEACAVGRYQPGEGATSCLAADAGYYVASTAAVAQFACTVGAFSGAAGAASCTRAPVGTYVDAEAATEATACPAGQTTAAEGATSADACFAPAESLTVSITPLGDPDVAHYGGLVLFRVRVENGTDGRLRQHLWLTLGTPSGDERVQYRTRVHLRPGRSAEGVFIAFVSRHADAGAYRYTASVGDYPDATGSDAFAFVKHERGHAKTGDAALAMNAFSDAEARTGGAVTDALALRMDGGDAGAVWGDADGAWNAATPDDAVFGLAAPFPNPASGRATVAYSTDTATTVHLALYDALGRQVAVLADGDHQAGAHRAILDGAALPAGVYLVRLTTADGRTTTQRMTRLR